MAEIKDTVLTEEEINIIESILFKRNQAKLMLDRTEFPVTMEQDLRVAFYKAAGDSLAEASLAEKRWWTAIGDKYGLAKELLSLDTSTGKLSVMPPKE